jgi:hypothetical protein
VRRACDLDGITRSRSLGHKALEVRIATAWREL